MLQENNIIDARCASWILWDITNPEALDPAISLSGIVQWFEDGLNVDPPYHLIVSALRACFNFNGRVYPGLRDRAYKSAQAVLWIHICAMCKSVVFASRFPLPYIHAESISSDDDLEHLLKVFDHGYTPFIIDWMCQVPPGSTPQYLQWTSNILLHLSWAKRNVPAIFSQINSSYSSRDQSDISLDVMLNHLLASCIFLGRSFNKDVLKIQDKLYVISYLLSSTGSPCLFVREYFDQIITLFSEAMVIAIETSHPQCKLLQGLLASLSKMKIHTHHLTMMAYAWCSVICKNYSTLADGGDLLFLSLKIGFRHLNPQQKLVKLVHTQHHQKMAEIVFESDDQEAIADLLHAWTSQSLFNQPHPLLTVCAKYFVTPHYLEPFPSRLRRLAIRCIELIGYKGFQEVGVEEFVGLLNDLHVGYKDMDSGVEWMEIFLDIIQTSGEIQQLSYEYWELLIQLTIPTPYVTTTRAYNPHIISFLEENGEWNKLKCWMGIVCILWPPEDGETVEEELEQVMVSLFHQQPGLVQEFGQWVRGVLSESATELYERSRRPTGGRHRQSQSFRQIYQRACCKVGQEVVS